jgi:hypothetical protein
MEVSEPAMAQVWRWYKSRQAMQAMHAGEEVEEVATSKHTHRAVAQCVWNYQREMRQDKDLR